VNKDNYKEYLNQAQIAIMEIKQSKKDQDNISDWAVDKDGNVKWLVADSRRYYVKEIVAPKAYQLDETIYDIGQISSQNEGRNTVGIYEYSGGEKLEEEQPGNYVKKAITDEPKTGTISLKKVSQNPEVTDSNACYSKEGALYLVTDEEGATVGTLITDKDGNSNTITGLAFGTYYAKETKASKGYKLDQKRYSVSLTPENSNGFLTSTEPFEKLGALQLKKISANPELTDNNPCYTCENAVYQVKNEENNVVGTLVTDKTGVSNTLTNLPIGSYTVQETEAPEGYDLDETIYTITITEENVDEVQVITSVEVPKNGNILLQVEKVDSEGTASSGSASLENTEFTVRYYTGYYNAREELPENEERVWVIQTKQTEDGTYLACLDEEHKVLGDDFYRDKDGNIILPLGTITVEETKAPEGYQLNPVITDQNGNTVSGIYLTQIRETEQKTRLTGDMYLKVADSPERFDFSFTKINLETNQPMANTVFRITSKTTGESHIIVTGADGFYSSAEGHSSNTNCNDDLDNYDEAIEGGLWFGAGAVDDSVGALLYDSYILEELPCKANEGMVLMQEIEISPLTEGMVKLGDIYNSPVPSIQTTAREAVSLSKLLPLDSEVELIDTVTYKYLTAGETYTLKGTVVDKETGTVLQTEGTDMKGECTFTVDSEYTILPTEKCGTVDVLFHLDCSELKGKNLVVYEELYDSQGNLVAEHKDIESGEQSVFLAELGTVASFGDGSKVHNRKGMLTVIDRVSYKNLIPGDSYIIRGYVMDKASDSVLMIDETEIRTEYEFTAEQAWGSVDITFTFDSEKTTGDSFVVFEEIYSKESGKLVAEHKDIRDEGQTVSLVDESVPETPEADTEPPKPDNPKTGDGAALLLTAIISMLALAGMLVMLIRRRYKR
jgi:hypothetical protein